MKDPKCNTEEGLFIFEGEDGKGIMNANGNLLAAPEYDDIFRVSNKFRGDPRDPYFVLTKKDKSVLIDDEGNVIDSNEGVNAYYNPAYLSYPINNQYSKCIKTLNDCAIRSVDGSIETAALEHCARYHQR